MKYLLIIGDGMADDPLDELGGKTPLQYANTPIMDRLTGTGILGNALTIPEGMQSGSDVAIMSIFGCDPREALTGRAPLEAAALGITLSPGDIAYRLNMVTFEDGDMPFEEKKIISHSAGSIGSVNSDMLIFELFESPAFKEEAEKAGITVYPGSSFRHIAVQKAAQHQTDDNNDIPDILTPPHDHLGEELGQYLPKGGKNAATLEKLMRLAHDYLDSNPINIQRRKKGKLPANGIWFWAEGVAVELPDFTGKYKKTGSVISAVPLCQGIGALMGLKKVYVEGATGELNTNYKGKVDAALEALRTQDFAMIHIEAPDECTHNGDLRGKLQAIEWVDSRIVAPLVRRLNGREIGNEFDGINGGKGINFRMLVMSDHRTLLSNRAHDRGYVPYVLYDSRTCDKSPVVRSFCEEDATVTGRVTDGTDLMNLLFEDAIF